MAKALLLLLVVAGLSALNYLGTITVMEYTDIGYKYVIFSVNLVMLAFTATLFSVLTGLEQKLEIAKLRLQVLEERLSPLKDLVKIMEMSIEKETVVAVDPGRPEGDHTAEVTVEVQDDGTRIVKDVKIDSISISKKKDINPRTKKPYKTSLATRKW